MSGPGVVLAVDYTTAATLYRLAAAQGLDAAQFMLGEMCHYARGSAPDYAAALMWFHLAAAQGYHRALYMVASCHENGRGVAADAAEAIRWYRRAQAAGHRFAAGPLLRLGVYSARLGFSE